MGHSSLSLSSGAGPKLRCEGLALFHSLGSAGADPGFPGKVWAVRAVLREPVQRGGGRRRRQLLRRQYLLALWGPLARASAAARWGPFRGEGLLGLTPFSFSLSLSLCLVSLSVSLCLSEAFESRAIPGCWTKRRPSRGPADAPGRVPPTPGEQLRRGTRRAPAAAQRGWAWSGPSGQAP